MHDIVARPAEWLDTAPLVITATRFLDCSASAAFAIVADHAGWPRWMKGVKSIDVIGAATGVGGRRRVHLPGVVVEERFTEWVDDEVFAFTVERASRKVLRSLNERVVLTATGPESCTVTYSQGWDAPPVVAPALRLAKSVIAKQLGDGLERLGVMARQG